MKLIARFFSSMILVLTLIGYTIAPSIAAESVRFALDWIPYGKHSGLFAGISQGFYAKAGLDVKIQRGFGADTLKFLSGGKADLQRVHQQRGPKGEGRRNRPAHRPAKQRADRENPRHVPR